MVNIQDELLAEDIDAVGARSGTAPRPKMGQHHQDNQRRADSAAAYPEPHNEPRNVNDLNDQRQDSSSLQGSSNFVSELRHKEPNIPAHADHVRLESRTRSSVAKDITSFDHRSNRQRRPLSNLTYKTNLQLK